MASLRPACFAATAILAASLLGCAGESQRIVVGSKNFTEQDILGEIVALWIERSTDVKVDRRLHLGGTFICHQAMLSGELDIYVEYTGTALAAILELPVDTRPSAVYETVSREYMERFGLEWSTPLGFDNTFAILVRHATADSLSLETITDASEFASNWTPGFGYEFVDRDDGLRGLADAYGLEFASTPRVMDLGLTYRALAEGDVDLIAGNSTDGQIAALGLVQLADDRAFFPPYFAAPVVRRETLNRVPGLRQALANLGGRLDTEAMRELNRRVDVEGAGYREVARQWVDQMLPPAE